MLQKQKSRMHFFFRMPTNSYATRIGHKPLQCYVLSKDALFRKTLFLQEGKSKITFFK